MIEIKKLSKKYKKCSNVVLNNLSINVGDAGLIAIIGENGAGKTSFLNIIAGLDNDYNGTVLIDGKKLSEDNLHSDISYLMQDDNLFENSTVFDNLLIYDQIDDSKIDELLKMLKIEELKNKKVKDLSSGEKRRVSLIKTLLKDSKVVLLDEPTSSLDEVSANLVMKIIKKISKTRLVIFTSHDKQLVNKYSDSIYIIDNCNLVHLKHIEVEGSKNITCSSVSVSKLYKRNTLNRLIRSTISIPAYIVLCVLFVSLLLLLSCHNFNTSHIQTNIMKSEDDNIVVEATTSDVCNIYELDGNYLNVISEYKDNSPFYFIPSLNTCFYDYEKYDLNFKYLGSIPDSYNEIMIYQILAEQLMYHGFYNDNNELVHYSKLEELIGKNIMVGNQIFTISGIIEQDTNEFSKLKEDFDWNTGNSKYEYLEKLFAGKIQIYNQIVITNKNTINNLNEKFNLLDTNITKYNIHKYSSYEDVYNHINRIQPKFTIEELMNSKYSYYVSGSHYSYSIENISYKLTLIGMLAIYVIPIILIVTILWNYIIVKTIVDKNNTSISIMKLDGFTSKELLSMYSKCVLTHYIVVSVISCLVFYIISKIESVILSNKLLFYFNPLYLTVESIITYIVIIILIILLGILLFKMYYKKMNAIKYLKNS